MATNVTVSTGEGSTQVTVITGEGATSYTVSAGSRGPAGATGATGSPGATGATGATGSPGSPGPNTITTSTTTPLVGFLSGNGETVTASTSVAFGSGSEATFDNNSSATFASGSQVKFDEGSEARFFSDSQATFDSGSTANFRNNTIKLAGTNFSSSLNFTAPTSAKTITLPDATGTVALTDDPRFTDARTPTAHTHVVSDIVSVSSQRLIGRHAGGSGAAQQVQVGDGLEFQGSGIRRSALTGDITASAGSNATTLAATIAGNKTFSGDLSFTSTTRPTSSGTGAPAGNSLITYDDAESLILRDSGGWLTHRIDNFETAMLTSVGGTAGFISVTGGADRPAMSYRPSNTVDGAANHQALIGSFLNLSTGTNRSIKNWSKRSRLSFSTMQPSLTNGTIRYYWGPSAALWAGGDLLVRGFGFEVIANSVFAVAHNGTTKTTSGTSVTLAFQQRTQLAIESDGLGGVRWWVNNVEQVAITGGPTGNSISSSEFGFCTQAINPTPASGTFVIVNNLLLASKI